MLIHIWDSCIRLLFSWKKCVEYIDNFCEYIFLEWMSVDKMWGEMNIHVYFFYSYNVINISE